MYALEKTSHIFKTRFLQVKIVVDATQVFNKNPILMILYLPASMKIAGLYVDFLLPIFITNMGRSCTLLPISITSAMFG